MNHRLLGLNLGKDYILWRVVKGRAVIQNLSTGCYYRLNRVGTQMWRGLVTGRPQKAIISEITRKYNARPEDVRKDLDALFLKCERTGLLTASSCPVNLVP